MSPPNLRLLWEAFLKLPDRKYEALDKFLWAYCQKWSVPGADMDQFKFGDAMSMCNVLAREFLVDIHRVCSQSDDENDTSHLQAYLLGQRGWKLLFAMHKFGLKGLSCGRELGTLLVSLLPWCLKFPMSLDQSASSDQGQDPEFSTLEECFSCLSKYTPHHSVHITRKDLHDGKMKSAHMYQRRAEYSVRKSFVKTSQDAAKVSSDSGDETGSKLKKKRKYRRFRSKSSKPRSHSLSHYFGHQQLDPFEDGDNLDAVLSGIVMDPSPKQNPMEFCCLVLDLVTDLCLGDSQPLSPTKTISSTIMPQLLQCLRGPAEVESLDRETSAQWPEQSKLTVQLSLLHVVLSASSMTVGLQNGVNILAGHRIIPTVLQAAECMAFPTSETEPKISKLCLKYVSDSLLGCLKLIEAVFHYLPFNLTFIKNAVNLMEEFRSHSGFEMLEQVVLKEDCACTGSDLAAELHHDYPSAVINVVADVISTLKITKVNYIHTMKCLKKKHRKCQFSQYLDHHHDILGQVESSRDSVGESLGILGNNLSASASNLTEPENSQDTTCLVAMLAEFLMKLLPKLSTKHLQFQTLSALYSSGICCCLAPQLLVDVLFQSATSSVFLVKGYLFDIMCRLLLEQLFGGSVVHSTQCVTCSASDRIRQEVIVEEATGSGVPLVADSGFSSNEALALTGMTQQQKDSMSKWKSLTRLKQLVFVDDLSLAALTAKHLCLLAVKGNSSVKKQLFFNIIFVVFQLFRHRRADSEESSGSEFTLTGETSTSSLGNVSVPVIHHCLAALPYLLQEDQILNAFLNKKGLQKLCSLLEEASLRQVVLKVLEALVIFDERRKCLPMVGSRPGSSSSSLVTTVSEGGESIGKLVMKTILSVLLSKAKAFCAYDSDIAGHRNVLNRESSLDTDSYDSETSDSVAGNLELHKLEQLIILTDLWNSCSFLCQKSPGFFRTFLESDPSVASLSYDKLREVMKSLSSFSPKHLLAVDHMTSDQTKSDQDRQVVQCTENMLVFKHRLGLAEVLLGLCFIAASSPASLSSQKLKQSSQLKDFMGEALGLCRHLDSIRLKLLFDMLLSCCGVLPKMLSRHAQRRMSESDSSGELLGQLGSSSGEDSGTFHTEAGYESDSESSWATPHRTGDHKASPIPEKNMDDLDPMAPVHRILVDLLVEFKQLPTAATLVPYVLQKLVQAVQGNRWHAEAMCSQGCLEVLISGFRETLVSQEVEDKEKPGLLLELIQLLSQNEVTPRELQLYLQLFQHKHAPVSSLLSTLLVVVETSHISPHYFLTFPVKRSDDGHGHVTTLSGQSLRDVCSLNVLSHAISDTLPWHTYQVAFTLTLWVAVKDNKVTKVTPGRSSHSNLYSSNTDGDSPQKRGRTDLLSNMDGECCHVTSLGTTEKLFEIWVNLTNGSIILRLTSDKLDGDQILTECDWSGILAQNTWHHLALMYSEKLDGSTLVGKAKLVVDGCDVREFPLDHPALKVSEKTPSLLIGHSVHASKSDWLGGKLGLGNIMLFKGASFTCDTCFHLYSLGPDCTSISKCDCSSHGAVYDSHLSKRVVLHSAVTQDVLVGAKSVALTDAQESLLLMYSPKTPSVFSLYPQYISTESASGAGNFGAPAPTSIAMGSRLLEQQPEVIPGKVTGHVEAKVKLRLEQSIQQAGGIGIFLFLVAKIYEMADSDSREITEQLQSQVTRLLLTLVQHMPRLAAQCDEMSGYAMLSKVLASPRSVIGSYTLKILFDASTTESILRFDRVSGRYVLRRNTEALVRNVQVVESLLLGWRIWVRVPLVLLETLFSGLELLIRGDHPHQEFNMKQFHSIGIVQKIFLIYQERLQEGYPALPPSISQSAVNICSCLMGNPPDSHLIISVCDFLLIMHPAVNTFVHNQKDAHFFNIWWNQPANSDRRPSTVIHPNKKISRTISTKPLDSQEETPQTDPGTVVLRKSASMPSSPLAISRGSGKDLIGYDTLSSEGSERDEETSGRQRSSSYPPVTLTPADHAGNGFQSMATIDNTADGGPIVFLASDQSGEQRDASSQASSGSEENSKGSENEGLESGPNTVKHDLHSEQNKEDGSEAQDGFIVVEGHEEALNVVGQNTTNSASSAVDRDKHSATKDPKEDLKEVDSSQSLGDELTYPRGKVSREEGVETLCEGLLGLLTEVVNNLPEEMLVATLTKMVRPEVLIILVQNQSPSIRVAVLKLLQVYLLKATHEQQEWFTKMEGFRLACNQLRQYPATAEAIELATAIVCGEAVNFTKDMSPMTAMSATQRGALTLLLGLLDKTVGNLTLCHNTLYIISQIFESSPFAAAALLDFGLVETLCNLLAAINATQPSGSTEQKKIVLDCVHSLLVVTALREYCTNGVAHFQQFEELLTLLRSLEEREKSLYGVFSPEALCVQTIQWSVLRRVFEYTEKMADGKDDSVSHFHNIDTAPGFNSLKSLLTPSFLSSRSSKIDSNFGNHLPLPVNSSTKQIKSFPPVSHAPPPAPKVKDQGFSVQRKLSAVLDFIMEGADSKFLGTLSGFEEVGLHGMADNSAASHGAGSYSTHYSSGVMSLDRKFSSKTSAPLTDSGPTSSWSMQMFSSKKKLFVAVSQSELLDRLKKTLIMAVNLVVYTEHVETKRLAEERRIPLLFDHSKETAVEGFEKFLYSFMFRSLVTTLERTLFGRKKNVIMWNAKDILKAQFGRLLTLTLSPRVSLEMRRYSLSYLAADPHYREVLRLVLSNQQQGAKMGVFIHELLTQWRDRLNSAEVEEGCKLVTSLRQAGFTVPPTDTSRPQPRETITALAEEMRGWNLEEHKLKETWMKKQQMLMNRIVTKYDAVSAKISASASEVTQLVTQLQNVERKKFFDHIKRSMSYRIQIKKCWQDLVQQLTHERAVWYAADSAPQGWQLDPTEGPSRARRRLQRCHLGLQPRFLKAEFQYKIEKETVPPPLIYLFEDDHQTSDSAALIYRLYTNEKIQHTCKCTAVTPANESKGEILIGENCVYFVADEAISDANYTQVLLGNRDQLSMTWPHSDIKEIHRRRYQLRNIALEIFLTNGKTYLLAFESPKEREKLVSQLESMELPNLIATENLAAIQQLWVEGHMTNFEYLTHLNKMAGRSFNDLMQYPVFPFILKDYVSKSLDLNNPGVFRDLSKPIAVQDKLREQKYIDNYNYLKAESERAFNDEDSVMYQVTPYHYGSHYSNSGTVLQFLVRLPPFTKMFLSYQDNNFDIPDRTFHSMNTAWRLSSYESPTDVKELIPEFFFLPDFLQNKEGYSFGYRQTGEEVSDVMLPPWSCQDARQFILIHRQALESPIVSQSVHEWFDLVFGYKQQGEMAVKAVNVFHPSTYFGVDVDSIKDPVRRYAMKTMIKTYGQTPRQLFLSPHPVRSSANENTPMGLEKIAQLFTKNASSPSAQQPQQLTSLISDDTMSPSRQVLGLSWGVYVGSPDCAEPGPIWQTHYNSTVACLVALPTDEVFGIGPNSCLLVMYSKERGVISMTSTLVVWAAIISWGYPDGVLRIQNRQNKPAVNFLFEDSTNEVCCCASLPDCRLLFTGGKTGVITVYNTKHNQAKESDIMVMGHCKHLYGHSGAVTSLQVCWPYSILVSASDDNTCIIWDLNRLTYVNTVSGHNNPIKSVAVSETLGDIASVSDEGMGSRLQLHTVNGEAIVSAYCQQTVHCLTYSSAPEGRSVNVIAGGLSSGVVRLWSSWDLSVVRDLQDPSLLAKPVVSLTFTFDNQRLYMSTADGTVTVWESRGSNKAKRSPPNFTPFTR